MSLLNKPDLLKKVVGAIAESACNVLYLASPDTHPFRLQIYRGEESYRLRVYIWNLTHGGGRARPQDEYRIQITGIRHFEQEPGEKTLILGWWQPAEVSAGFDFRKHAGPLGASPSIQIREEYLRRAALNGFAPCDKGNQEVAIAFRPDFFVEYIRNLESLHSFGRSVDDLATLDSIAQHPEVNAEDIQIADNVRLATVVSVSRRLRDANFRKRILEAYDFSCAICGLQLKLVDAAHILPVSHSSSTDETRNGLALCALHHRSYDNGLTTVWDDYSIRLNESQTSELQRVKQINGLDNFRQNLRSTILLPQVVSDRPHVEYIRIANRVRGWV